jgi:tetratricopeptide (TPR) repeat protein
MTDWSAVQLEQVEELTDTRVPWRPLAAHLGITAFGATTWTAQQAGQRIINEHDESEDWGEEELYVVMRGRATFELDGESVDAPTGTAVFARPGVQRTAFAAEAGTTVLAIGAVPGRYEPQVWSIWKPIEPLYEAQRYGEAADQGQELLKSYPKHGGVFFNLACCESLAGRTGDAIAHLARAIELSDTYRVMAREDTDLDPIRREPAFAELLRAPDMT